MLADALLDAIGLILGGILTLLEAVVPESLLAGAGDAATTTATVLQATPASIVTLIIVAWLAVDTCLNGIIFTINLYQIFPFKAT